MERPRRLVPVHRPQLRVTDREIPVRPHPRLVDLDMERAVHRLELVLLPLDVDGGEHALPVIIHVAAHAPEVEAGDVWGEDVLVPRLRVLLPPEILHDPPDRGALRMPQDEPRPDLVGDAEEIELLS